MIATESAPIFDAMDAAQYDLTIWMYDREDAWKQVESILVGESICNVQHEDNQFHAPESGLELFTCRVQFDVPRGAVVSSVPRLRTALESLQRRLACDVLLSDATPPILSLC